MLIVYNSFFHKPYYEGKRKEFVCSLCYAEFSRKDNYTIHVATVHEGQKPFKCSECDSSFPRKGELTKHIMFCHQGFYKLENI